MRHYAITSVLLLMTGVHGSAAQFDTSKLKAFEQQLDDVMELTDTSELKVKLKTVEEAFRLDPNEINKARMGIIYHETALNLSFFSKTEFKGYAQKSFDVLSELFVAPATSKELMPFVASYRASALSLVAAETKELKLLGEAFVLFADAVQQYAAVSYLPEFLRGSVAENLPWFFFSKRRHAKQDSRSIIAKQEKDSTYAGPKIMSFVYWAWANQHQGRKHRTQAIAYLDKAIALDPGYKAGRKRAEALKAKLMK